MYFNTLYTNGVYSMKLEHIKLFIQVVESGSINQAAKHNFITQQGLSQTLKQIEAELGITLFLRSHKGMHLTPEGEKFYRYGTRAVQAYDDFLKDLRDEDDDEVFNLYVSNNDSTSLPFLNDVPFMKKNNWYFSYITRSTAECVQLINNNKGIYFFSAHGASDMTLLDSLNPDFPIYKLGSEKSTLLVCHKDSPLLHMDYEEQQAEMQQYKCILFSSPMYDFHWKTDEFRRSICVTDLESYKKLLRERNTYTILTYNHYKMHFDPLEYVALRERPLDKEIKYYAAFHLSENEKNKLLEQELVHYLQEILES